MSRWVRRMKQVDGWETRFDAYLKTLAPQPSQYRVRRLALMLQRQHVPIGRGMFDTLSEYDRLHYGTSVRNEMIAQYVKEVC
jgi:hypothetical protein